MTEVDIKKIAREYAEENSPKEYIDPILREKAIKLESEIYADFLQYLSKDYAIVEKSKLRAEYKKSYSESFEHTTCLDRQYARGRYQVLREIFGKSLFNEEKE